MIHNYKAENVDTDKSLKYIEWSRKHQEEAERLELAKIQEYYKGVQKGLDIAEEIFTCSNYEKQEEPSFAEGVIETIYELGKELGISTQDLRDNFCSVDDICADLAKRIRDELNQTEI